ncbi:MAG TPA: cupin-like domain-containing protein [Myxococcaceae bacterium]|jgi:lysine-specific demethylase 8
MAAPFTTPVQPSLLRGEARGWPALRWTFSSLQDRVRGVTVPVHTGRWKPARWRVVRDGPTISMPADEFLGSLAGGRATGYLAGNELLRRVSSLRADLCFPDVGPFWVDVVWLGPAETTTPVHFDRAPNLYAQILGRKRWRLWRPDRALRPRFSGLGFSMSALDAGQGPEGAGEPDLDVVLEPGDLLVVPAGWWHHVHTLEPALAINRWWRLERFGRLLRRLTGAQK